MRPVRTITVKVDDKLRKRMAQVTINWSRYIREAIVERIEREERKKAAQELLEGIHIRKHVVPKGFINQTIRETRKAR
jgi:post-segregation antitoxin (ccd killing protein)